MTAARTGLDRRDIADAHRIATAVSEAFSAKVVGQENLRESLLIGLLTGGHVLIESVPGLAKTTAARVIAESIHGGFQRIQCTPDLLPSDIIGTQVYEAATNSFVTQLGPVHTNIVLLDEINRSSAKTQSAMLEAMEERQTTIAGTVYPIPEPFLVIATQNPVDHEGTFPLPEAQLDRFLVRFSLGYPSMDEELQMLAMLQHSHPLDQLTPVATADQIVACQKAVREVHIDDKVRRYITEIVHATRQHEDLSLGGSPRASIALFRTSQAMAAIYGRNFVQPDDVKRVAGPVLMHRLILKPESRLRKVTAADVVAEVVADVPVPILKTQAG